MSHQEIKAGQPFWVYSLLRKHRITGLDVGMTFTQKKDSELTIGAFREFQPVGYFAQLIETQDGRMVVTEGTSRTWLYTSFREHPDGFTESEVNDTSRHFHASTHLNTYEIPASSADLQLEQSFANNQSFFRVSVTTEEANYQ